MEKRTPLYNLHIQLQGKIVPFAGYELPVQYPTGVIKEHQAVRTACGLFDVSHMGEIQFSGPGALKSLQHVCTNDLEGMEIGRVRYSPVCNEQGGIVDDMVVCRRGEENYLLVVNAANKDKDFAWFLANNIGGCEILDLSDQFAQLALQGPRAPEVLALLTGEQELPTNYYTFKENIDVAGVNCLVSRTGYTGELGYELYCSPDDARRLAEALLEAGRPFGLIPCGLGARDTLRLEAGMPLYGHEMSDDITPLEANLGLFVKMDRKDFLGKEALVKNGEPVRTRVGLEITDRGIAREHCQVSVGGKVIGETTSGTMGPYVGKAIAMALVDKAYSQPGQEVSVDVRGRSLKAMVVTLPFYKRS